MNLFKLFGIIAVENEEANKKIDGTIGHAENAKKKLGTSLAGVGKVVGKIGGATLAAATAVGGAMVSLADNTRGYRTEMAKLDTAFVTNGHSSETATKTYKALQSVLGETDQAVEAANHLAVLCDNQKDLDTWTKICTGVYATFGASLPIEGLTEAANETAKTGEVTGSLADALNWAGISEDEFNKTLAACSSEEERQGAIMNTLIGAYKGAAEQFETTNKKVIESNAAHDNLNAAMAKLGAAAEPAVTAVVQAVANLAEKAEPVVKALSDEVVWLADNWGMLKQKMTDITATITVHANSTSNAASNAGSSVADATGSGFLGAWAQTIIGGSSVNPDAPWISWNADGAIFDRPTIFSTPAGLQGVGEAGAEAVAPIDKLQGYVKDAVRDVIGGLNLQVVLDSGALVGQIAPKMDQRLGTIAGRKGRGN